MIYLVARLFIALTDANGQVSSLSWYWQNPLPQGNTQREISLVHSNVMYAVGDFGTILKASDGGLNWTLLNPLTTVTCRSVWFTDQNNGVVVGDAGTVLKTSDGGASWLIRQIDASVNFNGASFADALTGTIVGDAGALYRTKDGGNTWAFQIAVPLSSLYLKLLRESVILLP